ncbi:MAG: hypothetical protein FWG49_05530 [Leptospirales bacterium]|nr:hypothetical protein [Leptospirales bacterium]
MNKKILTAIISNNNIEYIKNGVLSIQNFDEADILIVDEASDYDIIDELKEFKSVQVLIHNEKLGYGACLASIFSYARDLNYLYLITLDVENPQFIKDLSNIVSNLNYGYDVVTCSRILENYDHTKIDDNVLIFYDRLAEYLKDVTGYDLTDPLSENKGYNIEAAKDIDITLDDYGVLLQIFIQSSYFGYNIIEIPSESGSMLARELDLEDNPLEYFMAIIETEKYLYNRGSLN